MHAYISVAYSHCRLLLQSGLDDENERQNGLFTAKENGRRQNSVVLINIGPDQYVHIEDHIVGSLPPYLLAL